MWKCFSIAKEFYIQYDQQNRKYPYLETPSICL